MSQERVYLFQALFLCVYPHAADMRKKRRKARIPNGPSSITEYLLVAYMSMKRSGMQMGAKQELL